MKAKCMVSPARLKDLGVRIPYFPAFDRVLVYQLKDAVDEKASKGGLILKPESMKSREERGECRGVLIAAGAVAMDHLYCHAMEVGDVVWFSKLAVWRHVSDTVDGKDVELMFLRSADLAGSEESLARIVDGTATMERGTDGVHSWKLDGKTRGRAEPAVDEY